MKRFVLVGGGTGGHFYPLIAVAQHIRAHAEVSNSIELFYMGPDPYDAELLKQYRIGFIRIPAGKRRRYFSIQNYLDIFKNIYGIFVAIGKLYAVYPDVVFSKGGFTSVPVTLAAWFLRIPVVVHESDSKAGAANKLAGKFARYVAISFDEAAQFFPPGKTALTGIPLRTEFLLNFDKPAERLGVPSDRPIIFVTGGSQGAERVNTLILQSLDELLPRYTIIHQAGSDAADQVKETAISLGIDETLLSRYFVMGSLNAHEMNLAQTAASLIISRAGSGTIFEIAHKRKPAILIPIPEEISHDQRTNAYAYSRAGAAQVLEEGNMTDGLLTTEVSNILNNNERYAQMSNAAAAFVKGDAAEKVVAILVEIANEHP